MGNKFVTELANITQADADWWTAFSNAWFTYTSDTATARENYVLGIAPKIKDYHGAEKGAERFSPIK